jgi:hypothetical protein
MKKLLLIALLFVSFTNYAQKETFTKTYKSYNTKEDGVIMELQRTDLLVVFNEKNTGYICLYYQDGKTIKYNPYGNVEKVETTDGDKTQLIKAIDVSSGEEVLIQLFDESEMLRIIIAQGWLIEFYK